MDRASLQWVRADVDESLKQARVNLETFASDPSDVHRMLECAETLHGVQGVLEMLEVYGVSLLLDELEKLCRAVHAGEVTRRDDACEVLMQGIIQVPDYLDFVARGNRDNPIVLMPILNDVRSVRGQTLLSENALFSPDLDALLPIRARGVALQGDEFVAYVRKLRPHFQRGLVTWFRGTDVPGALQLLESVVAHVQRLIGASPSSRLWWVARAVIDALMAGSLDHSTSIKQLAGQLDRELRRFIRDGDQATKEPGPTELLKNLLYYCARSKSGGKRLETVRSVFGLNELVLPQPGGDHSPISLFGPDLDTVGTVSNSLKETLARVEDVLDTFNRTEKRSIADLQPLLGMLQQVGDTLGLLGLGVPRKTVVEQQRVLNTLIDRRQLPDDDQLMDIAAALLQVDKALDHVADRGVAGTMTIVADEPPDDDARLSGIEYLQLVTSVVGEAKADISIIKDAIARFITDHSKSARLAEIPERVKHIVGGMRMLYLDPAADLMEAWIIYVDAVLLTADELPDDESLERLADGIESLDYYLESIASDGADADLRLAHATACIETLPQFDEEVGRAGGTTTTDAGGASDTVVVGPGMVPVLDQQTSAFDPTTPSSRDAGGNWGPADSLVGRRDSTVDFELSSPADGTASGTEVDLALDDGSVDLTLDDGSSVTASDSEDVGIDDVNIDIRPTAIFSEPVDIALHDDSAVEEDAVAGADTDLDIVGSEADAPSIDLANAIGVGSGADVDLVIDEADAPSFDADAEAEVAFELADEAVPGASAAAEESAEIELDIDSIFDEDDASAELLTDGTLGHQSESDTADVAEAIEIASDDSSGLIEVDGLESETPSIPLAEDVTEQEIADEITISGDDEFDIDDLLSQTPTESLAEAVEVDLDDEVVIEGSADGEAMGEGPDALITAPSPDSVEVAEMVYGEDEITLTGLDDVGFATASEDIEAIAIDELESEDASALASSDPQSDEASLGADDVSFLAFASPELIGDPTASDDDEQAAPIPDSVERSLLQARDLLDRMEEEAPQALVLDPTEDDVSSNPVVGDFAFDAAASLDEPSESAEEATPSVAASVVDDGIDPEIIEVFLEEGDEVLEALAESLPAWTADLTDGQAMTEVRRSFHTLKGSGRMVGATTIGDFCWAIENALNRVIDGVIPATPRLTALVGEAVQGIPALLGELRGEGPSGVDVLDFADRAEQLAQAAASGVDEPLMPAASSVTESGGTAARTPISIVKPPIDSEPEPDTTSAEILEFPLRREEPPAQDPQTSTGSDSRDLEVSEVFRHEAEQHLSTLDELVAAGAAAPHAYIRPVHTLKGASRAAGADPVAVVCEAAEDLLSTLVDVGLKVELHAHQYLGDVVTRVRSGVAAFVAGSESSLEDAQAFAATGRELVHVLCAAAGTGTHDGTFDGLLAEREELRETFLEEAAEILDVYDNVLERWRTHGVTRQMLDDLQRGLHTLKGGARMAQIKPIGDLGHALETITAMASNGQLETDQALFDVVEATQDTLADMLDCLVAHQAIAAPDALIERINAMASGKQIPDVDAVDITVGEPEVAAEEDADAEDSILPERGERITVDAELLENLSGFAGEISISQSRIEQQVGAFRINLDEMDQTVTRLRSQLRRLELETESQIVYRREREGGRDSMHEDFDPLEFDRFSRMQELSRGLAESVGDLSNIRDMLTGLTRESESILIQQARTNTDLQHGLTQTRMLPFGRLIPRLRRVVRQTARELSKRARLEVTGEGIRVDRTILNRMVGSFEHLLRNAVDHGIEDVVARTHAGKPAEGVVRLDISREGAEVLLRVSDDGAGVSTDAVRRRAVERGLMGVDESRSDEELLQFIFEPAFSTRDSVTQISGRGVGLDVVQNDAKQLGGSARAQVAEGLGSEFILRLPLTLAINQALMVLVGHEELGLPLANVDAVVRMPSDEAERLETSDNPYYEHSGLRYPFVYLGAALSVAEPAYHQDRYPVVLMRAGDDRVAIRVDELRGRSEVVVKSVGPMLSAIRWVSGATIMGDGRVILILDAPMLTTLAVTSAVDRTAMRVPVPDSEGAGPTVMVVDDSITVRKVTGRFLQRNGMNVITAKDGVEALALLQEDLPDVMLLDIEMPRMDGFELATTIRNDSRMSELPIIMITSRTGTKHNERAAQIGVNRYLGKPYHEGELLQNINMLLAQEA
jgi:chemosensory pili system protein ChpA (sensor histidine kinase/response regulator)